MKYNKLQYMLEIMCAITNVFYLHPIAKVKKEFYISIKLNAVKSFHFFLLLVLIISKLVMVVEHDESEL